MKESETISILIFV